MNFPEDATPVAASLHRSVSLRFYVFEKKIVNNLYMKIPIRSTNKQNRETKP